jgi:hypothetical protein
MPRKLQGISALLGAFGGVMSIFSDAIWFIPEELISDPILRCIGLVIFASSVILFMAATYYEGKSTDETRPRLHWGFINTAYKGVRTQLTLNQGIKLTDGNIHSELEFAFLDIHNSPKNPDNGRVAQNAHATIMLETSDSKKIVKHGRWCDEDMPLFQPSGDAKTWKSVDIIPGNPETLVLAFKKKHGKEIYAFGHTDHTRTATKESTDDLRKERLVGVAPVKVRVKLEGRFAPEEFDLILDINSNGEFFVKPAT